MSRRITLTFGSTLAWVGQTSAPAVKFFAKHGGASVQPTPISIPLYHSLLACCGTIFLPLQTEREDYEEIAACSQLGKISIKQHQFEPAQKVFRLEELNGN